MYFRILNFKKNQPTQPNSCDWAGLSFAKTAISIEDSFVFNPILACLKIGVKLGVGPQLWSFFREKLGWGWVGVSFQHFWKLGLGWGRYFRKKIGLVLGIGCFGIVKLGCGWCCGDFHEKKLGWAWGWGVKL